MAEADELATFAGEAAELAACIGPHVGRADFFAFDAEKSNRVAELRKVPELWRSLQKLSDNFSFQREKLEMALGQVWDEKSSAWSVPLSDQFKSDWTIDQANRLKHACLFIAQAMKKAKPAKWAIELLGLESMPKRRHAGAKQKKGDRRPADEGDGDRRPADEGQKEDEEEEEGEEEEEEGEEEEEEGEEEEEEEEEEQGQKENEEKAKEEAETKKEAEEKAAKEAEAGEVPRRAGDKREATRMAGSSEAVGVPKQKRRRADATRQGAVGAPTQEPEAVEYVYGYCQERKEAFRAPVAKPDRRQYTKVYAKDGADPSDYVFAKWDGEEREVRDLLVKELKVQRGCQWDTRRGALWGGTLGEAKDVLKLLKSVRNTKSDNPEESLCIVTYPGGKAKQLLQVRIDKFSGDREKQREQAVALCTSLCQQLESGSMPAKSEQLQAARDKVTMGSSVADEGAASSGAGEGAASSGAGEVKKRPAASPVAGEVKKVNRRPAAEAPEADAEDGDEVDLPITSGKAPRKPKPKEATAEEKAKKEAEEKAKKEAEEEAKKENEEKAKKEAEAQKENEEKAKKEAEAVAQQLLQDVEEKAKQEAEEKAKEEAKEKARAAQAEDSAPVTPEVGAGVPEVAGGEPEVGDDEQEDLPALYPLDFSQLDD